MRKKITAKLIQIFRLNHPKGNTRYHKLRIQTQERALYLWRKAQIDAAEVIIVSTLWINLLHRLLWAHEDTSPMVYSGMKAVFGDEIYTAILIAFAVSGFMSFMLYLPKLRREIDLAIATYFVVNGVILLMMIHNSLLGIYDICIFGGAGAWTYWRQGLTTNDRPADT